MALEPEVVETLSPMVRRITANNPGVFTGPGTNTYLVGDGNVTVIDPGPAMDTHAQAIADAVEQLETELMAGRQDKNNTADSFDAGIMGGNYNKDQSYEELFRHTVTEEMRRAGHIGRDEFKARWSTLRSVVRKTNSDQSSYRK